MREWEYSSSALKLKFFPTSTESETFLRYFLHLFQLLSLSLSLSNRHGYCIVFYILIKAPEDRHNRLRHLWTVSLQNDDQTRPHHHCHFSIRPLPTLFPSGYLILQGNRWISGGRKRCDNAVYINSVPVGSGKILTVSPSETASTLCGCAFSQGIPKTSSIASIAARIGCSLHSPDVWTGERERWLERPDFCI